MDLPSQHPSSEDTKLPLPSSEETLIQPSSDSNSLPEETPHGGNQVIEEDAPTQPVVPSDPLPEETQSENSVVEDAPTQPVLPPDPQTEEVSQSIHPITEEVPQPMLPPDSLPEETELQQDASLDEDEVSYEEEDLDDNQETRPGVFIGRGLLIAAACAVVAVALIATLLIVVSRPKDPPTDWIASYTPTPVAGATSSGKILYYLHWTNSNGALQGQLQLATLASGKLESVTAPTTGLYGKDTHLIYVVITLNGQASTLTGKINDTGDTLTLNSPGATNPGGGLVFHTGSANDYKQATKKLK